MSNQEQFVLATAINFFRTHSDKYLPGDEERLIGPCVEYLQKRHEQTARSAERISINALAEIQGKKQNISKLEIADGQVVYVRDMEGRQTYAFTASMLKDLSSFGLELKHS